MRTHTIKVGDIEYAFEVPDDGRTHHVSAGTDCGVFVVHVDGAPVPATFKPAREEWKP